MITKDMERIIEDEAEMALLKRDQQDRRAWVGGFTKRVIVIAPDTTLAGGTATFYVASDMMLDTYLSQSPDLMWVSENGRNTDMQVLPLDVRHRNMKFAEGFPGKMVLRSMRGTPHTDASFYAADLVDTADEAVMGNFWINARNKLRERYKWPKGHFTMIDPLAPVDAGFCGSSNTPYVCVFRSDNLLASVSILIIK